MYKISRILLKYFTFGTNDEESRLLDKWRGESDRNENIFRRIGSRGFLENAMDPVHRKVLAEQWQLLEKETLAVRRRKRINKGIRWAAAVVIPMAFVGAYLYMESKNPVKEVVCMINEIPAHSKAVIHLAEGGQIVIMQDTVFQEEMKTVLLKNHRDTINFLSKNIDESSSDRTYQIEVPRGGEYVARLEDGTVIHMDAESKLTIPEKFKADVREVELMGHAYFTVKKDSTRPFIVKSGDVSVRVLGTEFDFNAYHGQEISTTLVKGSVEVYHLQSMRKLKPNQQATIDPNGDIMVSDVEVYPFVAWKEERIVFINQPLVSIMKVLERWYNIESVFLSNEMKQECFTLDIEKYGEITPVLKSIEKTNKVYFEIIGKQILVHKK